MSLDNATIRNFRRIGHHLSPIVMISSGLSENIMAEIDRALSDHELIKIKVNTSDREAKKALIKEICLEKNAELVQQIGHVALLFRAAKKPDPRLSNLLRYKSDS